MTSAKTLPAIRFAEPIATRRGARRTGQTPTPKRLVWGQTTMEYAVFIAVMAAAVASMSLYVRRAIQANLKHVEDRLNAEAVP